MPPPPPPPSFAAPRRRSDVMFLLNHDDDGDVSKPSGPPPFPNAPKLALTAAPSSSSYPAYAAISPASSVGAVQCRQFHHQQPPQPQLPPQPQQPQHRSALSFTINGLLSSPPPSPAVSVPTSASGPTSFPTPFAAPSPSHPHGADFYQQQRQSHPPQPQYEQRHSNYHQHQFYPQQQQQQPAATSADCNPAVPRDENEMMAVSVLGSLRYSSSHADDGSAAVAANHHTLHKFQRHPCSPPPSSATAFSPYSFAPTPSVASAAPGSGMSSSTAATFTYGHGLPTSADDVGGRMTDVMMVDDGSRCRLPGLAPFRYTNKAGSQEALGASAQPWLAGGSDAGVAAGPPNTVPVDSHAATYSSTPPPPPLHIEPVGPRRGSQQYDNRRPSPGQGGASSALLLQPRTPHAVRKSHLVVRRRNPSSVSSTANVDVDVYYDDGVDAADAAGYDDNDVEPNADQHLPGAAAATGGSGKVYDCTWPGCLKSFKNSHSLRSHSRCHGEPKFPCEVCGVQFRRKHDLHRHGRSLHNTTKPHACPWCGKPFPRADALRRHLTSRSVTHACTGASSANSTAVGATAGASRRDSVLSSPSDWDPMVLNSLATAAASGDATAVAGSDRRVAPPSPSGGSASASDEDYSYSDDDDDMA
ncbi:hypothetical protein HK405_010132 [Cladochytrium tenue]|nr:hypothetical protein HK405_010132 [Cladochytrium tenue]